MFLVATGAKYILNGFRALVLTQVHGTDGLRKLFAEARIATPQDIKEAAIRNTGEVHSWRYSPIRFRFNFRTLHSKEHCSGG